MIYFANQHGKWQNHDILLHNKMIYSDSSDEEELEESITRSRLNQALRHYISLSLTHPEHGSKKFINTKPMHRRSFKRNDYWSFAWGRMLRSGRCGDETTREGKYFRRRFRVPYILFNRIVQATRDSGVFDESHRSAPLEVQYIYIYYQLKLMEMIVKNFICVASAWSRWLL